MTNDSENHLEHCQVSYLYKNVAGAPARKEEKENPDYVPSIFQFPASHRQQGANVDQKKQRYQRTKSRQPLAENAHGKMDDDEHNLIAVIPDEDDAHDEAAPEEMECRTADGEEDQPCDSFPKTSGEKVC